jgi:hypothetical protein
VNIFRPWVNIFRPTLIPIYSKKLYKIIRRKRKKYKVDDGSYYYAEQLVKGTEHLPLQKRIKSWFFKNLIG